MTNARVLLSTVFQPFCVEDEFNAPDNLTEHGLVHRSFTERQGVFTILQQSASIALHFIAHNLPAQTTVLEYPTLEAFVREAQKGYDIVGIGCTASTIPKARRMCEAVHESCPNAKTVVGGAGALAIPKYAPQFSHHVCREDGVSFLRELLGEQADTPIDNPHLPTIHGANVVMGFPAYEPNFAVIFGLGCVRQCEFCSTSAQFNGKHIPIVTSGAGLFEAMRRVEAQERKKGRRHRHIGFVLYEENFLLGRKIVQEFRALNREQLLHGTQYLSFVFADAGALSEYTVEELLEAGVDSVWVGFESLTHDSLTKLQRVDFGELVGNLSRHGIKVFGSMMAGFEEHNEELIRRDHEYALSLPVSSIQYAPVCPMPGTPYFSRLEDAGMILDRSLPYFSMSHYNLSHPSLSEAQVQGLIDEFLDRDFQLNGPLVTRFVRVRWDGYRNAKESSNPYVRARAEIFKRDTMRSLPLTLLGQLFAPTNVVKKNLSDLYREVTGHFGWWPVFKQLLTGKLSLRDGGFYLPFATPGLRRLLTWILALRVLFWDPRTRPTLRNFWSFPFRMHRLARQAGAGVMPWGQPTCFKSTYVLGRRTSDPKKVRI